jgi:uncharacterized protein YndB with AHSA1/START domain
VTFVIWALERWRDEDIAAPPDAVYAALATTEGVAGWWTTKNETTGTVGDTNRYWFPGAPMSWDLRVEEARPAGSVAWHCVGGPPAWIGTDIRWTLSPTEGGTLVVFDHTGFAEVDAEYRTVTLGWAQMVLHLKKNLETGEPTPFFSL